MSDPKERAARLPCWKGEVAPEPLGGGITNINFTVEDAGERYVVRIGDDIPVHGVWRVHELAAARAAHAAGIAPEIVHAEPGALVMRWVEGRTLEPEDVRDPARMERVLDTVTRCHREVPLHYRGPTPIFWVFQVVRDYARIRGDEVRFTAARVDVEHGLGAAFGDRLRLRCLHEGEPGTFRAGLGVPGVPGLIPPREERTVSTDRVPLPPLPQVATSAEPADGPAHSSRSVRYFANRSGSTATPSPGPSGTWTRPSRTGNGSVRMSSQA